jgi:simple sugar transport system substrate-binding protein
MSKLELKSLMKAMVATAALALGASPAMAHGAKIVVIGGKPDDPFWSKVKKGADEAGLVLKASGGSVIWLGPATYDNLGPDAAKMIRTALSQHPTAIVGPDRGPEAEDDAFKEVVAAHVPLVIYDSGGMDAAKRLGAMNFVGNEEYTAGLGGGDYYGAHGAKNVLCVNTLPGATNTEERCKGIADAIAKNGGKSSQLPLPSSSFGNPTAVSQAIEAALLKNPSVDSVITISAPDANSAASAIA